VPISSMQPGDSGGINRVVPFVCTPSFSCLPTKAWVLRRVQVCFPKWLSVQPATSILLVRLICNVSEKLALIVLFLTVPRSYLDSFEDFRIVKQELKNPNESIRSGFISCEPQE
jgi:hypothetical protein